MRLKLADQRLAVTTSSTLLLSLLIGVTVQAADWVSVTIIDRSDMQSTFAYTVPGSSKATSSGTARCTGVGNTVNCVGDEQTRGTSTPATTYKQTVQGTAYALKIQDGRVVIVGCQSKFDAKTGGRRSCRTPFGDSVQALFEGDDATLRWPVSLDGKKTQSETYKIWGIYPAVDQQGRPVTETRPWQQ